MQTYEQVITDAAEAVDHAQGHVDRMSGVTGASLYSAQAIVEALGLLTQTVARLVIDLGMGDEVAIEEDDNDSA